MSLYNFLGKICVKVVADMLVDWCEVHSVLHEGQMRSQRQRSMTDAVARVTQHIQKA